jgi:hypothetical protein
MEDAQESIRSTFNTTSTSLLDNNNNNNSYYVLVEFAVRHLDFQVVSSTEHTTQPTKTLSEKLLKHKRKLSSSYTFCLLFVLFLL